MKISFDPDFDGGAWPGPLAKREAVAGEAWLGEHGLLEQLETVLGLGGSMPTSGERAAALVPALRAVEGFWSRSAEMDPLGSARELLRWRDELVLAGWRQEGEGMPPRVVELARLAGDVLPGLPDRIADVTAALESRSGEIAELDVFEPVSGLPHAWRAMFEALASRGTEIRELEPVTASAKGDLARARTNDFHVAGDGSLQLLRPDGPWASAVEVAAWLADRESLEGTVLIGPTPLLDTELRRFGLPTTGAREMRGGSSILEVLPLVLALGWKPPDPQDVAALLSLPESPIPRGIRYRLRRALGEWPAVGSDVWIRELAAGIEAIEEPKGRDRVAKRLKGILGGVAERGASAYPVAEIRSRTSLVRTWLHARLAVLGADSDSDLARALTEGLAQCAAFERIVDLARLDQWHAADLHRFLDEARAGLAPEPVHGAQAGLPAVTAPGALVGPARYVVWWNFTRESAPSLTRIPFTQIERAQLEQVGVSLPDPARRAVRQAARWRRPLEQATDVLLLVAPRANEAGEESHPHPLWDEIRARVARDDDAAAGGFTEGAPYASPRAPLSELPLVPPPAAIREWRVDPELVQPPVRASNSAIDDLLRCPLQWSLRRIAKLRGLEEVETDVSSRILGRLADALLEDVLPEAAGDAKAVHRLAAVWFDKRGPRLVAALFLPGMEAEAARIRRILCEAAAALCRFLEHTGLELRLAEHEIEGSGLGRSLFGIPDLVLGPRPMVIDAKWGGLGHRRDSLSAGTATQLAFYAHLLRQQEGFDQASAAVAFFVLSRCRLLTTDAALGDRAEHIDGPSHAETWLAMERSFTTRAAELADGLLLAPANPDEAGKGPPKKDTQSDEGALDLVPNCQWCDYGGLCGVAFLESDA